jgi:hypothetical protein
MQEPRPSGWWCTKSSPSSAMTPCHITLSRSVTRTLHDSAGGAAAASITACATSPTDRPWTGQPVIRYVSSENADAGNSRAATEHARLSSIPCSAAHADAVANAGGIGAGR